MFPQEDNPRSTLGACHLVPIATALVEPGSERGMRLLQVREMELLQGAFEGEGCLVEIAVGDG